MKKVKLNAYWVIRGGFCSIDASYLRATFRDNYNPSYRYNFIGVRLVRGKR